MTSRHWWCAAAAAGLLALAGCSTAPEQKKAEEARPPAPEAKQEPKEDASQVTRVRFDTTKGPILIEVHGDWAPVGAAQFLQLVKSGYYNGARFFRIVPNFVVQFGLAANPALTKKWDKPIKDDPVIQTNKRGSLAFATAGPNTRTTQVFINLRSNQMLDSQGFAPFAVITEGMEIVDKFFPGYGEQPDQEQITRRGNKYLEEKFPKLDYIKTAKIE